MWLFLTANFRDARLLIFMLRDMNVRELKFYEVGCITSLRR